MWILKIKKKILNICYKFLKYEQNKWCLAIIETDFKDLKKIDYKLIIPPKNSFWADPFVICFKKKIFVFFEEYNYINKKGHICCAELQNNKLKNKQIILKRKFHLSYPNVFKYNKKFYLIPETQQNNNVQIFKSTKFPFKWKLHKTLFKERKIVDTTFLEMFKKKYIFYNEKYLHENNYLFNKRLNVDIIKDLDNAVIKKHKKNPIIFNDFKGRNAGSIFKINQKFYRPSQINNSNKEYGYGLALSVIKKINENLYKEMTYKCLYPEMFGTKFCGVHHIAKINDKKFIIDLCFKKFKHN